MNQVIADYDPSKIDKEYRSIPGPVIGLMHQIEIILSSSVFTKYLNQQETIILRQPVKTKAATKLFVDEIEKLKKNDISYTDTMKYILYRLEVTDNEDLSNYIEQKYGNALSQLLIQREQAKGANKIRKLINRIIIEWDRIKADSIKLQYLIQYCKYTLKNHSNKLPDSE